MNSVHKPTISEKNNQFFISIIIALAIDKFSFLDKAGTFIG